ncbi:MAG: hypothetical protein HYX73_08295 [Acidobacteria bacterium]|nr:hypothetical protein [Acidobacteriota bacterium]
MPTALSIDHATTTRDTLVRQTLDAWIASNEAFRTFTEKYTKKIRAKMRAAKDAGDQGDVLWELEVAYLLLKNVGLTVEHEPGRTVKLRSPDFRVSPAGGDPFNVEVRRIRSATNETRLEAWERETKATIRWFRSELGVQLRFAFGKADPKLLDRLEAQSEQIKESIRQMLADADAKLNPGQSRIKQLDGFEGLLSLYISKPWWKPGPSRTSYYGCSRPILYTQREFTKFGDVVCEKLGQLDHNMANVLAIGSGSDTHEEHDCDGAIEELRTLAAASNNAFFEKKKKRFKGASDFLAQFRGLTGVVFRSVWLGHGDRNFVWRNPDALHSLDENIWDYFRQMD